MPVLDVPNLSDRHEHDRPTTGDTLIQNDADPHRDDDDVDADLDHDLKELFDDNAHDEDRDHAQQDTPDDDTTLVPASPERRSEAPPIRPKSILDSLLARRQSERLTSTAMQAVLADTDAMIATATAAGLNSEAGPSTTTNNNNNNSNNQSSRRLGASSSLSDRLTTLTGINSIRPASIAGTGAAAAALSTLARKRKTDQANLFSSGEDSATQRLAQEQQAKKARHAFKVVGGQKQQHRETFDIREANVSRMSLRKCPLDLLRLNALFEPLHRVDLSDVAGELDDVTVAQQRRQREWVTFCCVAVKHAKRENKNGAMYAVWTIYNMCTFPDASASAADGENDCIDSDILGAGGSRDAGGDDIEIRRRKKSNKTKPENSKPPTICTLLLCDDAFTAYHMLPEGSALALRKATILPRRNEEQLPDSSADAERTCLKVSKRDHVFQLGFSTDYGRCAEIDVGRNGHGEFVCNAWYDKSRTTMCVRHLQRKRSRMMHGQRMDVNNAERPAAKTEQSKPGQPQTLTSFDESIRAERARMKMKDEIRAKGLLKTAKLKHNSLQHRDNAKVSVHDHVTRHLHPDGTVTQMTGLFSDAVTGRNPRQGVSVASLLAKARNNSGAAASGSAGGGGAGGRGAGGASAVSLISGQGSGLQLQRGKELCRIAQREQQEKQQKQLLRQQKDNKGKGKGKGKDKDKRNSGIAIGRASSTGRKYEQAVDWLCAMGFTLTVDGDLIAPSGLPLLRKGEAPSVRRCSNASAMHVRRQPDEKEEVRSDPRTDQSGVMRNKEGSENGDGGDDDNVILSDESE